MNLVGIIPARYASSRFPGKPLVEIKGKSMLQRVYEQASASRLLNEVVVATDDDRIAAHCAEIGARCVMTGAQHPSGTDRCHEAYRLLGKNYDYVINIQGDEPFLNPEQIDALAAACDGQIEIATQMIRCTDPAVLFDAGEVKIALNANNEALYFSRSVIPAVKGTPQEDWITNYRYFRHVGMYAYRVDVLSKITRLPVSPLEKIESLEQLRWVENGYKIKCVETMYDSHCIDTPEDIEKVLRIMNP